MAKWMVKAKRADFAGLSSRLGIDMVTARLLVNRGVPEEAMADFLHPSLSQLHDGSSMKDLPLAADILTGHIKKGTKIRVIGDYDVDGIFSTYILVSALRQCGGDVDYAIPHRTKDGYGVNPQMIEEAKNAGIGLVLTCDNGISAADAVDAAKAYGMTVIVTDHHEIPFSIENKEKIYHFPNADAVVDPHRADETYPFAGICGAVVAWKLVFVLFEKNGIGVEKVFDYLEMAAIATVCDIMALQDENRPIVKFGLNALTHTKNKGLSALIDCTGIDREHITTYHIGFVLGPCFNASGRLETALLGLGLLLEEDERQAAAKAAELVNLNEVRKAMTEEGMEAAIRQMEEEHLSGDKVLVIYVPKLHESLCGIVAGRIKEKYYRPVFVLCDGESSVKGSGRSIPAYSMYERMQEVDHYFTKYGGHPMAAGLSMHKEDVERFRQDLNEKSRLTEADLIPKLMIDVPMPLSYLTLERVREFSILEPFGNGNEKPVFADKNLPVLHIFSMGKQKQYRKLVFGAGNARIEGVYFGDGEAMDSCLEENFGLEALNAARSGRSNPIRLKITYYPSINAYRGVESLQVIIGEYSV